MADVIVGTSLPAYTPTSSEVGKTIYCRVRAANVAGFAFRNSASTGAVAPGGAPSAPSLLSAPNIADLTPEVGEVLHTTDGTWAGSPAPTFNYQWHRVTVGAPEAPLNLTAPAIADLTPQVGETLHTTDGTWSGEPAPTFSYQWHRVTVGAPAAPSNLTAPAIADLTPQVGETLYTTDGTWDGEPAPTLGYQWHRVTVDPAAPSGGTPSIADTTPVEGETLHCDFGTWAGDTPITYAYQWKRGATSVGSDSADYLLGPADVTFNMSCVVTASNAAGSSSPVTSNVVGPVTSGASAPSNTGAPNIADTTPQVTETLHTSDGTWSGTPSPTFGYQWFKVGEAATITSSASATNVENTVLAHALTASQSVTWSLFGGADEGRFQITGSTLQWAVNATKNFEAPNDADLNNAYVVVVRAINTTGHVTDQTVTITVTNVAEATLTFDFTANTSTIAGAASTAVAPLTVTRTGTAAWAENVSGVWTNFAANTARRTDKGLLIEEARTNVCLQNRTQTNASWVKTNCTATKNQVGIDGAANSCCSLTATAANATCLLTTSIASSARWQTAFVKRLVGTGTVEMTQNNGTTWTALAVTSSWARFSVPTVTAANPVVGFRIVTSGDSIAVDMVQNENSGSFATSPITTTTATVARPADVIVINTAVAPIASWFREAEGTLYAEGDAYVATLATSTVLQIDGGAATNLHYVGLPGGTAAAGGTTTASTVVGTFNGTKTAGVNKSAWAYKAADMAGSFNGGAVVTDATGAMPAGMTTTRLGKLVAATNWCGYLRKITYYNERLDNATLVTLTTP